MSDIVERLLNGDLLLTEAADAIRAERALADDLADVLTRTIGKCSVVPLDDGRDPRERVLARYREARQR